MWPHKMDGDTCFTSGQLIVFKLYGTEKLLWLLTAASVVLIKAEVEEILSPRGKGYTQKKEIRQKTISEILQGELRPFKPRRFDLALFFAPYSSCKWTEDMFFLWIQ